MANKKVCVIGAGITGISLSHNLLDQNFEVVLIDKQPYIGGRAASYGCKATDTCVHCGVCLVRDTMSRIKSSTEFTINTATVLEDVRRTGNHTYSITLLTHPNYIDSARCIECGKCVSLCPEDAIKKPSGNVFYIDDNCTLCGKCVDICPVSAIRLEQKEIRESYSVDSLVVCTGFEPFNPIHNLKWGYGHNPYVITASELERILYEEHNPGEDLKHIAFIQCVGSRNITEGKQQCSRICCAFSLRMANRLAYDHNLIIDFYYMDIQKFGKNFESFTEGVKQKVRFIRSNPICITTDLDGMPVVRYESPDTQTCKEQTYHLVVLSHGLCPGKNAPAIADTLGLGLNDNGFFTDYTAGNTMDRTSANRKNSLPETGIFYAGTCKGPMRIDECIRDAAGVSRKIVHYLRSND